MATPAPRQKLERKALFVRIGWMQFYNGPVPGDERPVGGGEYNKDRVGHEVYNFREVRGRLYGYFQPSMAGATVNLARIDLRAADTDAVSGVDVVMVARRPEGGQVIVGWYRDAKVFRQQVSNSPGKPEGYGHFCSAKRENCVLLPQHNRTFELPRGKGSLGQANVCYALDGKSKPKDAEWITQAIRYIDRYRGSNILDDPATDAEAEVGEAIERALARSQGQGFAHNAKERRALEERAMAAAKKFFRKNGYMVEDVSARSPYDLLCRKGSNELHVEVKGTTTDGRTVILTRNEVRHAGGAGRSCVLFILHSMRLENGRALGGTTVVIDQWSPQDQHMTPIAYTYRVPLTPRG